MEQTQDLEIYIHIPFCVKKCKYCDFLSAPAAKQVQTAYMEALLQEIGKRACGCGLPVAGEKLRAMPVSSVFIGGGTPSVVDADRIAAVLEKLRECFVLERDAEITMELNPGTVTRDSLAVYRRAGVNRLSIGLQSAQEAELEQLGRIHDLGQFTDAYSWAREAGFTNINVDLMSAIPGQTPESWMDTLGKMMRLEPAPEHLSLYSLIVEEGTRFFEMQQKGQLALPDEDTERRMYWEAADFLKKAGYEHYEISNYAKPGYACRHNCGYWTRKSYLGFGIGAASLINNTRFRNAVSLETYQQAPWDCIEERQELSAEEQMEETMFLGLRMAEGIDLGAFRRQYGKDPEEIYREPVAKGIREGLLQRSGSRIALTRRGVDVSNYVMAGFLLDE